MSPPKQRHHPAIERVKLGSVDDRVDAAIRYNQNDSELLRDTS